MVNRFKENTYSVLQTGLNFQQQATQNDLHSTILKYHPPLLVLYFFLFKSCLFLFYVYGYVCLYVSLGVLCVQCLQRPEEGGGAPGAEVNRQLWVAMLGIPPLEEQPLTTKQFL